jgi:hypothetical protein
MVFESRVLRRVFGSKRQGVTGNWRKLRKEEPHDLYCSQNATYNDQIKENEMGWTCGMYGEEEK